MLANHIIVNLWVNVLVTLLHGTLSHPGFVFQLVRNEVELEWFQTSEVVFAWFLNLLLHRQDSTHVWYLDVGHIFLLNFFRWLASNLFESLFLGGKAEKYQKVRDKIEILIIHCF